MMGMSGRVASETTNVCCRLDSAGFYTMTGYSAKEIIGPVTGGSASDDPRPSMDGLALPMPAPLLLRGRCSGLGHHPCCLLPLPEPPGSSTISFRLDSDGGVGRVKLLSSPDPDPDGNAIHFSTESATSLELPAPAMDYVTC